MHETENNTKLLNFYILASLSDQPISLDDVKKIVSIKTSSFFTDDLFDRVIQDLVTFRFIEINDGVVKPAFVFDGIVHELACLTLEMFGPLQIRDLSSFVKHNLQQDISIYKIEGIIKQSRRLIRPYHTSNVGQKGSLTLYLLTEQIPTVGIRVKEYRNQRKRFELRRRLGILSEEDKEKGEKIIKRELREQKRVGLDELVSVIKKSDTTKGSVQKIISFQAQDGTYSVPKHNLHQDIWKYLTNKGITQLYQHQTNAIDHILSNEDVIVSTSSASGKTLVYMLPILDILIGNPDARFLYIAPTKSLAQDQKNKFNELGKEILGRRIAENFDGHTPKEKRKKILSDFPNIILTNEHMIHYTILSHHEDWSRFLQHLEFIVIDEIHWYRGVFGSHVANIFRRLNVIAAKYGSYPRFIGLSATIGNPKEFAEQLTGKSVQVVSEDTAPKPEKKLVIWNADFDEKSDFTDTAAIIAHHIAFQRTVLFFGRSRNMIEIMTRSVKDRLEPGLKDSTASYRAGLTRDERKTIEHDFFTGNIRGLNATSAMELGIDVGDLDTVILFGYPGSLSSFWQRANRAGRRDNFSLIFYVPLNNPVDQYFMSNPGELTNMNFEEALINPDNKKIMEQHIKCLVKEAGRSFLKRFYQQQAIDYFINLKTFVKDSLYSDKFEEEKAGLSFEPEWDISLRASSNDSIRVMCNGEKIAETDADRAPKEVFEGAVFLAQGEKYLVKKLSFAQGKAEVIPYPTDEMTSVISTKDITIEGFDTSKELIGRHVMLGKGRLNVKEYLLEYVRTDGSGTVIERRKLNFKPKSLLVDGLWILFTDYFRSEHAHIDFKLAVHGLVHLIMNLAPIHTLCDINDISGSFSMSHKNLQDNAGGFIFETNEYGVALIESIYKNFDRLLRESLVLVTSCPCESGCPRCIHSQQCSFENRDVDKRETIKLIKLLLKTKEKNKEE